MRGGLCRAWPDLQCHAACLERDACQQTSVHWRPHTPHGIMHGLIPSHNCSSSPPLPQGIVGDDLSTSQHAKDSWGEEGRPCGHLHVNVSSRCGSHVGVRSHRSCAQVGPLSVCTLGQGIILPPHPSSPPLPHLFAVSVVFTVFSADAMRGVCV